MKMNSTLLLGVTVTMALICSCRARPDSFRACSNKLNELILVVCGPNSHNSPAWDTDSKNPQRFYIGSNTGIVEECCYRPCDYDTIRSYCNNSNKRQKKSEESRPEEMPVFSESTANPADGPKETTPVDLPPEVKMRKKKFAWKNKGLGRKFRARKKRKGIRRGRKGRKRCVCRRRLRRRLRPFFVNRQKPSYSNKENFESFKRTAPVFGTVSPEYLKQPRTLDSVPTIYTGFSTY